MTRFQRRWIVRRRLRVGVRRTPIFRRLMVVAALLLALAMIGWLLLMPAKESAVATLWGWA